MEGHNSSTEELMEKGVKIEKTFNDFQEGKLDLEEFKRIQKENFESLMEESWVKTMMNMDNDTAILFGNLMNKKYEREGKPPTFSGPEVPVPPELLEAVCQIPNQNEEEMEEEEDEPPKFMFSFSNTGFSLMIRVGPVTFRPSLQSIWGSFGETDSGSEGEY